MLDVCLYVFAQLLKDIREEVRKFHVKLRAEEARRLEAEKNAKKMQKMRRKSKAVSVPAPTEPKLDNVEYVGKFMSRYGKLANVIELQQLAALASVLRNAFKDMDKLPSGNVSLDHLRLQVKRYAYIPVLD